MSGQDKNGGAGAPRDVFVTTRWTVVLAAGRGDDTETARTALGELCQTYWYPLDAFVRRRGCGPQDAEDRVQGFFARLIRLNSIAELRRGEGRFRAFLLGSLKHYLADEWDRESAARRDVRRTVSWDAMEADARYAAEPADALSPERLYARQWAFALLEGVCRRLRAAYEAEGKGGLFVLLQGAVTGGSLDYGDLAGRSGQTEGALRVAAHRLRQRYRQVLREAIAETVERPEEVESELADLRRALAE